MAALNNNEPENSNIFRSISTNYNSSHQMLSSYDIELIKNYYNANFMNDLAHNFSEKSMIACMASNQQLLTRFW